MEGESAVMAVHGPEIDRAQRERRELAPEVQGVRRFDARRLRGPARCPVRRRPRSRRRHRHARGDPRAARLHPARQPPTTPGRTSAPSCFRRSMRPRPARNACDRRVSPARCSPPRWRAPRPGRRRRPAPAPSPAHAARTRSPRPAPASAGAGSARRRPGRRLGPAPRPARGGVRARLDAAREHRGRPPAPGAPAVRRPGRPHRYPRHRHRSRRAGAGDDVNRQSEGARPARLLRRRRGGARADHATRGLRRRWVAERSAGSDASRRSAPRDRTTAAPSRRSRWVRRRPRI